MAAGNANRCVFPAGLLLLLVICENGNSTNAADAGPFKGIVGATPEILDVLNAMTKKIGVLESQMSVLKRGGPKRRDPPPHAVDVHPVDSGLSHLMRKAASGIYPLRGPIRAKLLRHTDIGDSYSTAIQAAMVSRKKTTETKFDHTTDVKELLSDGKLDMGTVRGLNQADLVMKNQILVGPAEMARGHLHCKERFTINKLDKSSIEETSDEYVGMTAQRCGECDEGYYLIPDSRVQMKIFGACFPINSHMYHGKSIVGFIPWEQAMAVSTIGEGLALRSWVTNGYQGNYRDVTATSGDLAPWKFEDKEGNQDASIFNKTKFPQVEATTPYGSSSGQTTDWPDLGFIQAGALPQVAWKYEFQRAKLQITGYFSYQAKFAACHNADYESVSFSCVKKTTVSDWCIQINACAEGSISGGDYGACGVKRNAIVLPLSITRPNGAVTTVDEVTPGHGSDAWFKLQAQIRDTPSKSFKIWRAQSEKAISRRFEQYNIQMAGESDDNKRAWIKNNAIACDENALRYFQTLHG